MKKIIWKPASWVAEMSKNQVPSVTTAHIQNMQQEIDLIWDHLLPTL